MGSNSVLYDKKKQFYDVFLNDIGTAVHFTFENPLFTPENQPFTLHRGALSNSTAAVVPRGDVSLGSVRNRRGSEGDRKGIVVDRQGIS